MTVCPDNVVLSIVVEINNQDGTTRMGEIKIMVIFPAAGEGSRFRLFKPTGLKDDILLAVSVDVTESHAVPVVNFGDEMALR